jgi:hypothetical protein
MRLTAATRVPVLLRLIPSGFLDRVWPWSSVKKRIRTAKLATVMDLSFRLVLISHLTMIKELLKPIYFFGQIPDCLTSAFINCKSRAIACPELLPPYSY